MPLRAVDPRAAGHPRARDPAGQHRSQFVANIDLAPTIVQATGAQPGRVMDGRSLIPFAKDKLLQSGRDILLETPTYAGVRSPNWLYAEHMTGEKELYNLARDRDELNSLQTNLALDRMKANLARVSPGCAMQGRLSAAAAFSCRWARACSAAVAAAARRGSSPGSAARRRDASRHGVLPGRAPAQAGSPPPFTVFVPKRFAKPDGSLLEALTTLSDSRRQTLDRHIVGCSF